MRYKSHLCYIAYAIWTTLNRICVFENLKTWREQGLALCLEIDSDYRTYWLGQINQGYCLYCRTLSICSISMAYFAMTNTIFLYENIEYCRVRSNDSEYLIFSLKCFIYLFIIIFLNDTRQFSKIDTSIVFYITFDYLHHFPRKLYGALEESELYNLIYRNQGFH